VKRGKFPNRRGFVGDKLGWGLYLRNILMLGSQLSHGLVFATALRIALAKAHKVRRILLLHEVAR
jgi:small basic protein